MSSCPTVGHKRIVYVVNLPAFFISHRMALAEMARAEGYSVSVITPEGEGVEAIRAAGFDWHPMRFDAGGMNPLHDIVTVYDLAQLFRRLRPDIVHNVTVKPVLYGTFAARLVGVPRVINAISGLGYLFTAERPLHRVFGIALYRVLMRHPDMRVILQNREDMAMFRSHGLASDSSLRLIRGSGVDVSQFIPTRPLHEVPIVLQISRMVGDKGVREFIAAAAIIHRTRPEVRFVLAGPLYPGNPSALEAGELHAAEFAGHITWLGMRNDIATLLSAASVFCLPSYREGLPKVLLEAGACGLPLVTTDTPGCREVVQDGVNGLLVPVADAPALAAALERLLVDPQYARMLGDKAREIVVRDFTLEQVLAAHLALYHEPALTD